MKQTLHCKPILQGADQDVREFFAATVLGLAEILLGRASLEAISLETRRVLIGSSSSDRGKSGR